MTNLDPLRNELLAGLDHLEHDGRSLGEAAEEVIKIGIALSVASNGPALTIEGMTRLLAQIAQAFPEAWQAAKLAGQFPPTEGNA